MNIMVPLLLFRLNIMYFVIKLYEYCDNFIIT